jgi:enamine deaminase RidA (YjgF/YER057c/UK114 family)
MCATSSSRTSFLVFDETRRINIARDFRARERVLDATSLDARLLPRGYFPRAVAMNSLSGALNKAKAWGDEKLPQMKEKMKEIGEKTQKMIVPPSGSAGNAQQVVDPALAPLRALQRPPIPNPEGTPEMRLLVVLQPPEELPAPPLPAGTYDFVTVVGSLVYVSGIGPLAPAADAHLRRVGATADPANGVVDAAGGKSAARACALTMLAVLRDQLGSLNHIKRLVKATGFVNSAPDFTDQAEVMNGFSETMIEMFGDAGKGARSAVGVAALPKGWAVEVEAIFELKENLCK